MIRLTKILNEIEKYGATRIKIDLDSTELSLFNEFAKKIANNENTKITKTTKYGSQVDIESKWGYVFHLEKDWSVRDNEKDEYVQYKIKFDRMYKSGLVPDEFPSSSKKFKYTKNGYSILKSLLSKNLKYILKHGMGS